MKHCIRASIIVLVSLLSHTASAQMPDSVHLFFGLGTNFDFLNNSFKLNNVYGELKYINDRVFTSKRTIAGGGALPPAAPGPGGPVVPPPLPAGTLDFRLELGGYRGRALSRIDSDAFISSLYINPYSPITGDSLNVINQRIKAQRRFSLDQLSLYAIPGVTYNFNNNVRIGLGAYMEMYRVENSVLYSNPELIQSDTLHAPKTSRVVSREFKDSIGTTQTYGYFGLAIPLTIIEDKVHIRFKAVIGRVIAGSANLPYPGIEQGRSFYLFDASIMEPHSKFSVIANIRGLFPNSIPIWGVYLTKQFDVAKLFE